MSDADVLGMCEPLTTDRGGGNRRCFDVGHCKAQTAVRFLTHTYIQHILTINIFRMNAVAVTPLCENLPGPSANKPGDVYVQVYITFSDRLSHVFLLSVYAMNGKSVEIDNTDAEGRLVLAGTFNSFV